MQSAQSGNESIGKSDMQLMGAQYTHLNSLIDSQRAASTQEQATQLPRAEAFESLNSLANNVRADILTVFNPPQRKRATTGKQRATNDQCRELRLIMGKYAPSRERI